MQNGSYQAVDQINAMVGCQGRNPDVDFKWSQQLMAKKVVPTIGLCNSGVAIKSLETHLKFGYC